MFTARVVRALTGIDVAAPWRGYDTGYGAMRILTRDGGVEAIATRTWGQPKLATLAHRGDAVLIRGALGICAGHVVAIQGQEGVAYLPLSQASLAWTV